MLSTKQQRTRSCALAEERVKSLVYESKNHRVLLPNYMQSQCERLLGFLNSSEFDSLREEEWFQAIEKEFTPYAIMIWFFRTI